MASVDEIYEYQNLKNRLEELTKVFEGKAQELLERKYKPNPEEDFYGVGIDKVYFSFKKNLVTIDYNLQWTYKIKYKTMIMKFKEFCDE